MSKWSLSGILRKKLAKDNYNDLLVFGYACKLFNDDEKALYIDQGKHLIPWMADDGLKIDRYDGRGALSDLASCEASKEGYDTTRWLGLSESERKIEQLCDEERYHSLLTNEEEEAMYKEEELKRQQTNEFQYSYDVPRNPEEESSQDSVPTCEEEVKPYVPPTELDVPVDINIPKTLKESARIEKTALFVSKQGPQMEILIKAKQADNPQFKFMNQNDTLYKYYRHVLSAIKSGRYKPTSEQDEIENEQRDSEASSEDHYLHPSLVQPQAPPSVNVPIRLPTIPYKPTADCAYTQLVTRIQGTSSHGDSTTPPPPPPNQQDGDQQTTVAQMTVEQQQQYYQYYYSMQYYEYYKQITQQYAAHAGCDPQTVLQNPQIQEQIQTQASQYAQAAYNQYVQQTQSNPYAQIVTNLAQNIKASVSMQMPSMIPEPVQQAQPPQVQASQPPETLIPEKPTVQKTVNNPLLSLVHYSSDSEEEEAEDEVKDKVENGHEDTRVTFKVPPDETAIIIDKMANYVSKNGSDFESIVRSKGDPRFDFLNSVHEFNKYYNHKLEEYRRSVKVDKKPAEKNGSVHIKEKEKEKLKEKKIIAPVSFSIKKTKEESPKEIRSALPMEESDDESEETTASPQTASISTSATISTLPVAKTVETKPVLSPPIVAVPLQLTSITESHEWKKSLEDKKKITNGSFMDGDDPILEMIDLTDDLDERRDNKRAEDKIKDKLATAAKEKMSRTKDRALQMDRRKRAAMFLKMKFVESTGDSDRRSIVKVSDSDCNRRESEDRTRKDKEEILRIDDSESEEGEIKPVRKGSSKKKKSHKRKTSHSRSRRDTKSHHKKSKKRRRRSRSTSRSSTESAP